MSKRRPPLGLALDRDLVRKLREAIREDLGAGDVTTESIVPRNMRGRGRLSAKARGVFCGAPVAERVMRLISPKVSIRWKAPEGANVEPGDTIATLEGPYRALLTGERLALNFLQRLSGIATMTRDLREAAGGGSAPVICDTRKTTPLWRGLERYAVRAGGGVNHRFGLFDMVLIKENHIRAAGGIAEAIRKAKSARNKTPIAVEARGADEVRAACAENPDLILLDNMTPARVRAIVRRFQGHGILFEISGGVNRRNIRAYARTGVDRISIGALTHSAPALDLSIQLYPEPKDRRAS